MVNLLSLRRQIKKEKNFLHSLFVSQNSKKLLSRSSDSQRFVLSRILNAIAKGLIKIKRSPVQLLAKSRKLKALGENFAVLDRYDKLSKKEQISVLKKFSKVYKHLLDPVFATD